MDNKEIFNAYLEDYFGRERLESWANPFSANPEMEKDFEDIKQNISMLFPNQKGVVYFTAAYGSGLNPQRALERARNWHVHGVWPSSLLESSRYQEQTKLVSLLADDLFVTLPNEFTTNTEIRSAQSKSEEIDDIKVSTKTLSENRTHKYKGYLDKLSRNLIFGNVVFLTIAGIFVVFASDLVSYLRTEISFFTHLFL
ncbi:hypothetical protein NITGR_240003 [Nitrospina gracilis 3/211]|uniref:Uncharacterized protein n=1 Tax=Nitrospina gracilis (strain 3/211) TaxID=1266370 RepID=M1YX72_NITG3|nr:hypothetical protein [Nitrospina gracilis]CCQ90084.1 hypothetical protein NITGR_240003 [Nitrospina gracilis 3/211]